MAKVFESEVVTIRRRVAILAFGLLVLTVNLLAVLAQYSHVGVVPTWFTTLCTWVLLVPMFLSSRNAWPIRRTTRLLADGQGIWLDGKLSIPRESITSGHVVPGVEPIVRILRGFRMGLDIRVGTPEDVPKLIDALGLGVSVTTARFGAIYGGMRRAWIWAGISTAVTCVLPVLLVMLGLPPVVWAGVLAGAFACVVGAGVRSRATIVVGADGLLISRVGTKEFIAYGELVSVTRGDGDVTISRRARPPLRLGLPSRRYSGREYQGDALVQRIEEARAACAGGDPGARVAALVARGGRSPRAWLEAIHALLRDPGYREAVLLPEHMWSLVEDPSGDASTRAGAAAALTSSLDDEGRGRLRIAAQACAAPRLRVAFETAADAEAEAGALEEALACLVRDQPLTS